MKISKGIYSNRLFIGLLAGLMMFMMTACGSNSRQESEIRETVNNFEKACKDLDVDGILDCLDPAEVGEIRRGENLLNFVGIDTNEVIASVVAVIFGKDYADSNFLQSVDLSISQVKLSDSETSAVATSTISYDWEGETRSEGIDIQMILAGDDDEARWYIKDIAFK